MARITAPAFVVGLVNELCIWYETKDSRNPLSYPSSTPEARAGEGRAGVACSIVPLEQLPGHLCPVDRAMNQMPEDMRVALLCRHLADAQTFHRETGSSRATWYKFCDAGYWFIAGCMNNQLDG